MYAPPGTRFAGWLQASMLNRGLSQAQLARSVGVADTFGVQRMTLDLLVGLPVARAADTSGEHALEPEIEAELQAYQARLRRAMQNGLPRSMWRAYVEACVALADGLGASAAAA